MREELDDLGASVPLRDAPGRIVSLVPSLTESLAVGAPDVLVGATEWCTHPDGLDVARVRGTKNPDLDAIARLQPDLVVCNQEENRKLDVERMRARGLSIWVTRIETLDEAFASLTRLFTLALGRDRPDWLQEAERVWSDPAETDTTVAVPIWRDPWMVVGSRTFTGDLLARAGARNVFGGHAERYPHVEVGQIIAAAPDVVLLPDEPYLFTSTDGPEALGASRCSLVEGRALTWYGPSLVSARRTVVAALLRVVG